MEDFVFQKIFVESMQKKLVALAVLMAYVDGTAKIILVKITNLILSTCQALWRNANHGIKNSLQMEFNAYQ